MDDRVDPGDDRWHPTLGPRREYEVADAVIVTEFSTPDHVLYLLLGHALSITQILEFNADILTTLLAGKPETDSNDRRTLGRKAEDFADLLPDDLPELYREAIRRRNYLVHEILRDHEWTGNLLFTGPETYWALYERIRVDTTFIESVQNQINEHLAKSKKQFLARQGREHLEVFEPDSGEWVSARDAFGANDLDGRSAGTD
jgi:hypothetical protein